MMFFFNFLSCFVSQSGRPALRDLCKEILSVQVQKGEHSSVSLLFSVFGSHFTCFVFPLSHVCVRVTGSRCSGCHEVIYSGEEAVGGGAKSQEISG